MMKLRHTLLAQGGVMLLKLEAIDVFMIQIIGCWKSDSFMKYIRKQIQEFTSGITCKMLDTNNIHINLSFAASSIPVLQITS